ncbi:hypothetical protein [Entomobacter blattae]|uniref:hypothetical protein n=1 Tax=Entomobacter blattae TaxID=2762277 RepID=UPI00193B118A|nr:hypothetical protein [Entomobacter blattae]
MGLLFLGLAGGVAGCGSVEEEDPYDQNLYLTMRAGDQSASLQRYSQAEQQYQKAYFAAVARNDHEAIENAAYNLALTQLAQSQAQAALKQVTLARQALLVRGVKTASALDLVAAAAQFRLDHYSQAALLAERAMQSSQSDIAERAAFIRGLIADEQGDNPTLRAMLGRVAPQDKDESELSLPQRADKAELQARFFRRSGQLNEAQQQITLASGFYRRAVDYRSMARSLAFEGDLTLQQGHTQRAGDFYLQAAQSLLLLRDDHGAEKLWRKIQVLPLSGAWKRQAEKSMSRIRMELMDVPVDIIKKRAARQQENRW